MMNSCGPTRPPIKRFHSFRRFGTGFCYANRHFFARAAKEDAKKREREQHQAMMANRGMFMGVGSGSGANGAAEGVGHVQPLGYGAYGECHGARWRGGW